MKEYCMGGGGAKGGRSTALFTWQGSNGSNLNQAAILLKGLRKKLCAKIEDREDASTVTF